MAKQIEVEESWNIEEGFAEGRGGQLVPVARLVVKTQSYLEIWNEVRQFIKDNVELGDDREYDVLTGWVFASWLMDWWTTYPYIYLYGMHKSGKTRCQDTLMKLTMSSISSCNMSLAVLYTELDKGRRTLYIDEFAMSGKIDDELRRNILQVLNAGYKKGSKVKRCKYTNKKRIIESFDVGGFKCLASVFGLPDTLRSRCIIIRMRKTQRRFPMWIDEQKAKKIQEKLYEWQQKVRKIKKKGEPIFEVTDQTEEYLFAISGRDGRLVEIFAPIYVVAPNEKKPILIEYLKDLGEAELEEELASWECEVLIAILKVHSQNGGNWFSTKSVTEAFNEEKPEREKVKTSTIGRQIRQFGFRPHRSAKRKGWRWDKKLTTKLKERYPIAESAVSAESAVTQDISQYSNQGSGDMPSETAQTAQTASPQYIEKLEKELKQKGYNYKIHRGQER